MKPQIYVFFVSMLVIAMIKPSLAINLDLPPVVSCLAREGREKTIQNQLVKLEVILYNWKITQGNIIRLINDRYGASEINATDFDKKMKFLINNLNELTNILDKETNTLKILVKKENNLIVSLPENIFEQKSSGLLYLKVILGSSETTLQKATLQYDSSWSNFAQTWNMVYSLYGCSSINPWVTY